MEGIEFDGGHTQDFGQDAGQGRFPGATGADDNYSIQVIIVKSFCYLCRSLSHE